MKHYEKLIELGCFSRSDIAAYLGNDPTAASLLRDYLKKGYRLCVSSLRQDSIMIKRRLSFESAFFCTQNCSHPAKPSFKDSIFLLYYQESGSFRSALKHRRMIL